jgi:hypothetical protein
MESEDESRRPNAARPASAAPSLSSFISTILSHASVCRLPTIDDHRTSSIVHAVLPLSILQYMLKIYSAILRKL